jgi:hypothetical protein
MNEITKARNTIIDFLKESVDAADITVIKLEKASDCWQAVAEVYVDDSFLKSMNMPPKKTRVFYSVQLDPEMEVTAFERMDGNDS